MAIRAYGGTARPVDSVFEGKPGFRVVERDHADGSIERGYERLSDGRLFSMATMVVSPARQAALDAANAAAANERAQDNAFLSEMDTLAVAIRDNTATAAQQRRFMVKLYRMVKGILRDL